MFQDQKDLLVLFNKYGVKYLVIGGYAVGIHSEPRGTKDLDLFIKADQENSERVFRALAEFGAPVAGMSPSDFNDSPTSIFQMGSPPSRIDILQGVEAIDFDEAWANRTEDAVGGDIPAHFISRADLIRNKLAVGRHQDLADVEKLREAAELDGE
jgi:hypothetical protein